jgi:type I restriction enzyme S subunit
MRPQQAFREGYSVSPAQPNDFIISLSSHAHGIEWCGLYGGVSPDYTLLRPIVDIRYAGFLKYALKSQYMIGQLGLFKTGIRMGLRLTWNKVRYCNINLPSVNDAISLSEQLDRATARIDALVAKKTRFIELLREKRQALITHAVTKGLDAGVPMKDSGVEWLGQIPSDWDAAPLRVFLRLRRDNVGSASATTRLLSLTLQGVIERDLENPTGKMPASFDTYQRVSAGEMVFCLFDIDETPRTVGIAPQDGMITSAYTVFHPLNELWARYLYYFFLHIDEHKRLKPFYKGMRKTIRSGPFLSIQVPRPTEGVAASIVAHLDRATSRIDTLIAKTERSIELLREHRTALITAAVTGKIDLRNAA